MERHFLDELDQLKKQLLMMSAHVERNIGDAIQAFIRRDYQLAEQVRNRDPEIDLAEIRIDEHCMSMLALYQPVARDLRFITTALKIVKDLERIGDHAADIAKQALAAMADLPIQGVPDLSAMTGSAQQILKKALDAFVKADVKLAWQAIQYDDEVDRLHEKNLNALIALMIKDPPSVSQAIHLIYVNKYLERIGDHSSNIAEMVIFMVEGKDIRHLEKIKRLSKR
ncbi:MAG: phosphate signaling complex protein PhoU [Acidobacteria bacterium]|nr:phosphate signaling complex protein PhoU [Acidobacteriota bacterium]